MSLKLQTLMASSPRRIAANRLNALKSTGPRTVAGKRRSSLNSLRRSPGTDAVENQLRARGEDLGEFHRLHRDLVAIFQPQQRTSKAAVGMLAQTWWEKRRRARAWVAAGAPCMDDLDSRLEELLQFLVINQRLRHQWWHQRLASVPGRAVRTPTEARELIEEHLLASGHRRRRRKYPLLSPFHLRDIRTKAEFPGSLFAK
ncbi:MAG TPA: hypothetical protein VG028_20850 [Terriglobia bacterium]|nr:hypothetical protein [Terriglobia bacterium]